MKRKQKRIRFICIILAFCTFFGGILNITNIKKKFIYPKEYSYLVEKYAAINNLDENYVYAVIKTESNFNPEAISDAGAMGLMQIMEDSFEWVKFKMGDTATESYSDICDPEVNIKYGTYLLKLLLTEYGSMETSSAAYHTGRGNVNKWLTDKDFSTDGKILSNYPSDVTEHYVNKVMTAYKEYTDLYNK